MHVTFYAQIRGWVVSVVRSIMTEILRTEALATGVLSTYKSFSSALGELLHKSHDVSDKTRQDIMLTLLTLTCIVITVRKIISLEIY